MQRYILKNKTATAIALFMALAIAASLFTVAYSKDLELDSYYNQMRIVVGPNPIGVGQTAEIVVFLQEQSPLRAGRIGADEVVSWVGYEVTVWRPDGTTEIFKPIPSATGTASVFYTPTQVGIYSMQGYFPGQQLTGISEMSDEDVDAWFEPSTTTKISLTVQEEPLPYFPEAPLPTDYWTRPIYGTNREWWSISGAWLFPSYDGSTSCFNPYSTAPNTAHILWTEPLMGGIGGLVGGEFGSVTFHHPLDAGEYIAVALGGRVYYGEPGRGRGIGKITCADIHTGERLWSVPGTFEFAQEFFHWADSGTWTYLWDTSGSTWTLYQASDGQPVMKISGRVSGGKFIAGANGELLYYNYDAENDWISMWNSTYLELEDPPTNLPTIDWSDGIQWNVTVPHVNDGLGIATIASDVVFCTTGASNLMDEHWAAAFSTEDGSLLWGRHLDEIPPGSTLRARVLRRTPNIADGILTIWDKDTFEWKGYNVYTGEKVWGPTSAAIYDDTSEFSTLHEVSTLGYGRFFTRNGAGTVKAFNLQTGEYYWTFDTAAKWQTVYPYTMRGAWLTYSPEVLADGKLFVTNYMSHHPMPLPQTNRLNAIDVYTGELVWDIKGYFGGGGKASEGILIHDGILVAPNAQDNTLYAFGKGPSATTVTAPDMGAPLGTSILIRGSVTDQSRGAESTPAISDEDMTAWMEYMYMQQAKPTDAKGVTVKLTAIDPNGNYQDIGEVTSDMWGNYGKSWVPPVPGDYIIMAEFEGSASYGSSSASTYIVVDEAPSPAAPIEPEPTTPEPTTPEPTEPEPTTPEPTTPEPTTPEPTTPEPTTPEPTEPEPTEPAEAPLITTEVAILAAVIIASIIGVVSFWALRKRK